MITEIQQFDIDRDDAIGTLQALLLTRLHPDGWRGTGFGLIRIPIQFSLISGGRIGGVKMGGQAGVSGGLAQQLIGLARRSCWPDH